MNVNIIVIKVYVLHFMHKALLVLCVFLNEKGVKELQYECTFHFSCIAWLLTLLEKC